MGKNLSESLGTVGYDNLFVANCPEGDVVTVTLATAANPIKRGTVITGTPGGTDFAPLGAAASATKSLFVLADDADTSIDPVATAYRTGHFNRGALLVADGYTLTAADEEMLRKSGILLADALEY